MIERRPSSDGEPTLSRRAVLTGLGLACATSADATPTTRLRYADGLSFLPNDPRDIRRASLDAFICDVSVGERVQDAGGRERYVRTFEACDRALDTALQRIRRDFPGAYVATSGRAVGHQPGCAIVLQFQSCEPIGEDLSRIGYFHRKGVRVLQITHNDNDAFGGACLEPIPTGLTPLGREGIDEMRRVGIIPDISHAAEPTALDVARRAAAPVILSHGACRALVDNPRCATDAMIRGVAESGGVFGLFMMSFWLTTENPPTPDHYLAHVRHAIKVGGIDCVGVANDYPMAGHTAIAALNNNNAIGVQEYYEWWERTHRRGVPGFDALPRHAVIAEFNSIHRMRRIECALRQGGFRDQEVEKIMGGNWLRFMRESIR